MLPFGVTIPSTAPQRSEIPEGPMNYPVLYVLTIHLTTMLNISGNKAEIVPQSLEVSGKIKP
jgi:hypothetical protein